MPNKSEPLIPARFLFRFSMPLLYRKRLWTEQGVGLEPRFRLMDLAALEDEKPRADVRMAWNSEGLAFSVRAEGKRQPPWCRDSRLDESDGLQLWVDTRPTHAIHRASRFCHRFAFLPAGGGRSYAEPVADQLLIHRARENARPIRPEQLRVRSERRVDGYVLEGFIPTAALTGFDPAEHPQLGFTYALVDRERGDQTFSVGEAFPYAEDPSTWAVLEMMSDE